LSKCKLDAEYLLYYDCFNFLLLIALSIKGKKKEYYLNTFIKKHPDESHPIGKSFKSTDSTTVNGVSHRDLYYTNNNDLFLEYMLLVLHNYHINPKNLEKREAIIKSLNHSIPSLSIKSQYPKNPNTQKGNFAEIFLAEYLQLTTDAQLPIYKLRYNPNVDQSMKGDDVLLFDLDSTPVRIIVGEAKFRESPTKAAVVDIINNLICSYKVGIPMSLQFVADRLFESNNDELGKKIFELSLLFSNDMIKIDYVGLLMSNLNVCTYVNKHSKNELHNLLMISLGMNNPISIIDQAFKQLDARL